MKLTQLQPDIERMVDGLLGHVWPGGHRSPPIMDPVPRPDLFSESTDDLPASVAMELRPRMPITPDFAWVNGRAVPVVKESLTTGGVNA